MKHPTGTRAVLALVAGVVTVQALMLLAFAWPAAESGPREVPIAVAGPPQVAEQVEQALAQVPGRDEGTPAFAVTPVDDEAAATAAIQDRDVYGAVVVSPDGPAVLVASAASPAVSQALRSVAGEIAAGGGGPTVTDVVPTGTDDPTGAGLAAGVLPLVLTSVAAGLGAVFLARRTGERLAAVVAIAVAAGLVAAALLQFALGVVDGPYLEVAGVLALLVGAVAAAVGGLAAVLGRAGAALGALVVIFLGNPLSAAASAPELLPQPWGDLGQLMPPGAGVSALRSVAFFDGSAAGAPVAVLSVWLLAGLVLVGLGMLRQAPGTRVEPARGTVPVRGENRSATGA